MAVNKDEAKKQVSCIFHWLLSPGVISANQMRVSFLLYSGPELWTRTNRSLTTVSNRPVTWVRRSHFSTDFGDEHMLCQQILESSLYSTGLQCRYLDPKHQDRDQLASDGLDEGDEVAGEEGSGKDD
jgi:hypothetical protein